MQCKDQVSSPRRARLTETHPVMTNIHGIIGALPSRSYKVKRIPTKFPLIPLIPQLLSSHFFPLHLPQPHPSDGPGRPWSSEDHSFAMSGGTRARSVSRSSGKILGV